MSYTLERYKGMRTKHICPSCGRGGCFVYYVKEDGTALDPHVGRCDHESSCGYHYKPRDFFKDHPDLVIPDDWKAPAPVKPRKLCTIPKETVEKYRSNSSTLVAFLLQHFQADKVLEVAAMYQLGATADGAAVFWQIDRNGKPRSAKIMAYGPDGHRIKAGTDRVSWLHRHLMRAHELPDDFELTQAFFGEHLLRLYPDKPVAIVESEKTALICAITDPYRLWLASSGLYGLNAEKMAALVGRKIYLFPDADAIGDWRKIADDFGRLYNVTVCDPGYTPEDITSKHDLADLILLQNP